MFGAVQYTGSHTPHKRPIRPSGICVSSSIFLMFLFVVDNIALQYIHGYYYYISTWSIWTLFGCMQEVQDWLFMARLAGWRSYYSNLRQWIRPQRIRNSLPRSLYVILLIVLISLIACSSLWKFPLFLGLIKYGVLTNKYSYKFDFLIYSTPLNSSDKTNLLKKVLLINLVSILKLGENQNSETIVLGHFNWQKYHSE